MHKLSRIWYNKCFFHCKAHLNWLELFLLRNYFRSLFIWLGTFLSLYRAGNSFSKTVHCFVTWWSFEELPESEGPFQAEKSNTSVIKHYTFCLQKAACLTIDRKKFGNADVCRLTRPQPSFIKILKKERDEKVTNSTLLLSHQSPRSSGRDNCDKL